MESDGLFPTTSEIRAMLGDEDDDRSFIWPVTVPQQYGARKLIATEDAPLAEIVAQNSVEEQEIEI